MNLGKLVPTLRASGFGLDLEVPDGARVWLRGANGAGKTTILRALAGLPTHVDVAARIGIDDPGTWPAKRLRDEVAYLPQDARHRLIGLTVAGEARLRGVASIRDSRDVATLSTGEATRVALDLLDAPVWLLDEPATHLDAAALSLLRQRIAEHPGTILFTDHTGQLSDLADEVIDLGDVASIDAVPPPAHGPARLVAPAQTAATGVSLPPTSFRDGLNVLTGPNGSGKTSLLRVLAGLDGEASLDGTLVRPGIDTAMVGPDPFASLLGERVSDLAQGPLVPPALHDRHPWTLSPGEAQRVALTRALARAPPVLLLDEPEAHLDASGLAHLYELLAMRSGITVMASHHGRSDVHLEAS